MRPGISACVHCAKTFPHQGAFLDLRADPSRETLLDLDTYDAEHGVGQASRQLASVYGQCIAGAPERIGSVLEIGAGSGNLTLGLVQSEQFESIVATDISAGFLNILQQRLADQRRDHLALALVDGNSLPFADNSFDAIVGHSILHHIAEFETTLAQCQAIVKPGGACVFGEPVLDIHAFASLLAASILACAEMTEMTFARKERQILRAVAQRSETKRANIEGDRSDLANVEDKFQFSIEGMQRVGKQAGFSSVEHLNTAKPMPLGDRAMMMIQRVCGQSGVSAAFLAPFQPLAEAISTSYGKPLGLETRAPFGFFIFRK